jgi:hypothetical protein
MLRERAGGLCGGRGLMVGAAIRESQGRRGMTWPVPQGLGRADGRAVVMDCDEPRVRGGGGSSEGWRGLLCADRACRWAFRDGQVCCWWAGGRRRCHGVVTSGAKHGGTEADTLRRFLHVGGREGRAGTGEHGLSLTGGQVVAGSNPVSPTRVLAGRRLICGPQRSESGYPRGVRSATGSATRFSQVVIDWRALRGSVG